MINPSQRPPTPADHRGTLIAGVAMMLIGWVGLYQIVMNTLPLAFPRWLFFILLFTAVVGTATPFIWYLNIRLTPQDYPLPSGGVIVRQSIWVGLFVATSAWLQIPRVLNPVVIVLLATSFVIIEVYLRMRERAEEASVD